MLKRVMVVGDEKFQELVRSASQGEEVQFAEFQADSAPPPGTAGVIAASEMVSDALAVCLQLGVRQEALINLLAEAIDCRESFVPGSSARVHEHAVRFAKALGLNPAEQMTLERGVLVRDIGKLKIPNDVLLKDGVLTYEQWMLLQKHPHIGADLIKELEGWADVEEVVRRHHECFNGEGYPDGLEGESIPLLARIVKIIDVYCAMTSPRHYRRGHSTHEGAVDYLLSERGKHFDPKLVDVFVNGNIGQPPATS